MALKPEIKRWVPETGFVVFFQALWEGKLVARCLNLGKFSTQTFHKCSRKMQNDGTAPSMMIRFNRNFSIFFFANIFSCLSCYEGHNWLYHNPFTWRGCTRPTHPQPQEISKDFQGGFYRIHLMWQNKNGSNWPHPPEDMYIIIQLYIHYAIKNTAGFNIMKYCLEWLLAVMKIKTLPNAQRTRGLSSYHKITVHKSWTFNNFRISIKH